MVLGNGQVIGRLLLPQRLDDGPAIRSVWREMLKAWAVGETVGVAARRVRVPSTYRARPKG